MECAERAVHLTNGNGTKVEFVDTVLAVEECNLNSLEGTSIEQSRVVCEFLKVHLGPLSEFWLIDDKTIKDLICLSKS